MLISQSKTTYIDFFNNYEKIARSDQTYNEHVSCANRKIIIIAFICEIAQNVICF